MTEADRSKLTEVQKLITGVIRNLQELKLWIETIKKQNA
jgi:hypothetical protein